MEILFLSNSNKAEALLPALTLLNQKVKVLPLEVNSLMKGVDTDLILIDSITNISLSQNVCKLTGNLNLKIPIVGVFSLDGLVALRKDWNLSDFFLNSISPTELNARLMLLSKEKSSSKEKEIILVRDMVVDFKTYSVKIKEQTLDLTFKEFELLKYLLQNEGRVFSRSQLLREVWGYDYFGGTRTVDVHVRRLRAKLGLEYEPLIKTVRNVGYKLVLPD